MTFKIIYIIMLTFLSNLLVAQNISNVFSLRNYKQTETITIKEDYSGFNVLSSFGSIKQSSGSDLTTYKFQGQEYDPDLDIHFFPSRIYSSINGRFLTPDPKSQYYSPYLFVNADPVNLVDWNGNEGKPIVFYGLSNDYENGIETGEFDLMNEVGDDAYFIPLSDFLNGDVGDLPEWNGNVFVSGHMGPELGKEIVVERSSDPRLFESRNNHVTISKDAENEIYNVDIDAEHFGRILRRFSEERGVPVNSIVAGGCEGTYAAEQIGKGFQAAGSGNKGRTLVTKGVVPNKKVLISGPEDTSNGGLVAGLDRTRVYVAPSDGDLFAATKNVDIGGGFIEPQFQAYYSSFDGGKPFKIPYVEGKQVKQLVNARIPKSIAPEYNTFYFPY